VFIPYRARIKITRVPVMTIAVTILCLLIYWAQERSFERVARSAAGFCTAEVAATLEHAQRHYLKSRMSCDEILMHIYYRGDQEKHLAWHQERITQGGDPDAAQELGRLYRAFVAQAPSDLTLRLAQQSGSWNPLRLLSATIAHASWDHVIGNLFFFFAFGMVVETIIGPVLFLLIFLAMGLGTGALENLVTVTREEQISLGLSGVVMSVMTLAAWFAPQVRIKFFFFYFLFFGVMSFPLWSVAVWYVFWNVWDHHFFRAWSNINYVAHLTGAVTGVLLGMTVFRQKRHWVREQLVIDEPTLKDEESWLYKLNAMSATPVLLYFVVFYGFFAIVLGLYLFMQFIQTFAAQLLLAAPVVAGLVQIYRLKRNKPPDRFLLNDAQRLMGERKFEQAERLLKPLAQGNDPRAQFLLGRVYASAPGALRNDREAIGWFEQAARRGHADALYELGSRCLHGMGLVKDLDRAIDSLGQAARRGHADAARTLGYLFQNAPKNIADPEKAIEWYYRAGQVYQKAGRRDDARAMIAELKSLAAKYPAVYALITELEALVEGPGPHPAPVKSG